MGHAKAGEGVPSSYRKDANNKIDILWKVKIKGRKFLADNIPLHMSLRVFDYLDKKDVEKVKEKVRELDIRTPDSSKLTYKTTLFHSKHTGRDYFMLKVKGMHESCGEFFNYFKKGYGFSHKEFMSHITIDKPLYDSINKEGLKPDEIEFSPLTIEEGANNTVHEFRKSEDFGDVTMRKSMDISPNEISEIEDIGILNGGNVKMLRTKGGFYICVGRPKGKLQPEALTAGSHPSIVKYNLEKQFPEFQPTMMKSEFAIDGSLVEKHSKFLSEDLIKSGHDLYSIQNGPQIEFQITKHNSKIASVMGNLVEDSLVIKELNVGKEFSHALAGATSEKALSCGSKKIRIQKG